MVSHVQVPEVNDLNPGSAYPPLKSIYAILYTEVKQPAHHILRIFLHSLKLKLRVLRVLRGANYHLFAFPELLKFLQEKSGLINEELKSLFLLSGNR